MGSKAHSAIMSCGKGLHVSMVRNVMWSIEVEAENWYEADGRSFRETLAPLSLISITVVAAAIQLQGAAFYRLRWRQLVFGSCLPQANQRAFVSLGSGNSAKTSRMMSRSAMLGGLESGPG